jgi:2-dehydropantoate 2-reductase
MKICVVGAGAIGGLLAVHLSNSGNDVTVVDVGDHLEAIKRDGLKLLMGDGTEHHAHLRATDTVEEVEEQDLIILAVKAQVLPMVATDISGMCGPNTMILPVQNGLPWWYFQKHGGEFEGHRLQTLDPTGVLTENIDVDRIIGCVVFPAGEIAEPGVIRHIEGNRFPLGELDGNDSERVESLVQLLTEAGFKSFQINDIRAEMWLKLWGNMSFNPISAMTHATLVDICQFDLTRTLARNLMSEAQDVANRLGITFRVDIDRRIGGAEKVGAHKTSMLQDVEAGRTLEIDAIIAVVAELGGLVGVPTPSIDAVHAMVALLDETLRREKGIVKLTSR